MARDFTISKFRHLVTELAKAGYAFRSVADFFSSPPGKVIVLRHDVDARPQNSLITAYIEKEERISGTYYFRCTDGQFDEETIKKISSLGHEVGYHYEDLYLIRQKAKDKRQKLSITRGSIGISDELADAGFENFRTNLTKLREIVPVRTICMHGSPMSRIDNRLLWRYHDYRQLGLIAEPYFDISFEEMLYLTDTGRTWGGSSYSVRDKAMSGRNGDKDLFRDWKVKPISGSLMNMTAASMRFQSEYSFRSSDDIAESAGKGTLPERLMITVHPQRWNDRVMPWFRELVWQNAKNAVKYFTVWLSERQS